MGTTTSTQDDHSQGDLDAIIGGMNRGAQSLPPQLRSTYQPPIPSQIQPPAATPASTPPTPTPPTPPSQVPGGNQPIVLPQPTQQALVQPPAPRFQQGNQPGPWPQAFPASPVFTSPDQYPPLPGETPDETQHLNAFAWREARKGNVMNDIAAKDPSQYAQGHTDQGYWQIVNTTWQEGAQMAGVDLRQYPTAMTAPYRVQRQVALALYRARGDKPWASSAGAGERGDKFQLASQRMLTPERRDSQDWGHPPPVSGDMPGATPQPSEFGRIMSYVAPALMALGSIALRLPLSTTVMAYSAMARAQANGQREAYQRSRTQWQDKLAESNAQQTLESKDASDAFDTYGQNNPQGLQQRLMQIALTYNDPILYATAAKGDLNGAYKLQADRDLHNQSLTKVNDAVRKQRDAEALDADVAARDRKWHDDFVAQNGREPTADETAIEHVKNQGLAGQDVDPGKAKTTDTLSEPKPYDVIDKDGNVVRTVNLRDRKDRAGFVDADTGQPFTKEPDQTLEPHVSKRTASGRDATEGDYTWTNPDGSRGEGLAKIKGKQLVDGVTDEPIPTKPGTRVNKISTQAASQAGNAARGSTGPVQDWEGMKEGLPPPGVSNEDWVQAQDWARMGRAPVGLSSRTSAYQGAHDALPYALHALGKTGADMPGDAVDFETRRTASTATERYFASGMGARQLTALDTVAAHIQLFRDYAAAVKNGSTVLINEVAGRLATATGSPELIDMGIAATITGDEVIRLLTQTGGSRGDREDIKQKLSVYSSPEQFEGIANTLTNFVRERYDPLKQQYTNRFGATDEQKARYEEAFKNKLTPAARAIGETKAPIAGAAVPAMTEEQYNTAPSGTRYRMPNDPPGTVRIKP